MGNEVKGTAAAVIKALDDAKPEDLVALDQEISSRRNDLQALEAVRKLLDTKLNGKKGRKPATKTSSNGAEPRGGPRMGLFRRRKMVEVLCDRGGLSERQLAAATDIPDHAVKSLTTNHPWFIKDDGVVRITPQGRQEALDD